ncbi:MAG: PDZ domain-containing protein, partial [Planctomycetes bacterium]|nr:PDZ domain-containing protein [Planctomycetota bacterium]
MLSALLAPLANAAESSDGKTEPAKQEIDYELFKVFVDTLDQVDRNYVKDVDRRKLIEAAIRGMLSELDPYSSYINPKQLSRFETSVESKFGGIGIQITTEGGPLRIISPLVGSPAYRAGVQAGDRVVKINGKSTKGIRIDEAVRRLKGDAGTSVEMTIIHAGETKPHTIKITREVIKLQTVLGDTRQDDDSWDYMLDHDRKIGYIRLTSFGRRTSADLRKALDELTQQNVQGLILALRFNPGGLLSSA